MGLITVLCQGNYQGLHPEGIHYYKEFPSKLRTQVVNYCSKCKRMKTRKKDIKLALSTVGLVKKIRRELPPVSKPFVDKKRLNKLDVSRRKAKHKAKEIGD